MMTTTTTTQDATFVLTARPAFVPARYPHTRYFCGSAHAQDGGIALKDRGGARGSTSVKVLRFTEEAGARIAISLYNGAGTLDLSLCLRSEELVELAHRLIDAAHDIVAHPHPEQELPPIDAEALS